MPEVCIRSFIWIRPAATGISELVPMKHHESGPGVRYPNGGGYRSQGEMIEEITRRTKLSHSSAIITEIDRGIRIDYQKQYPNCDVQEITWED